LTSGVFKTCGARATNRALHDAYALPGGTINRSHAARRTDNDDVRNGTVASIMLEKELFALNTRCVQLTSPETVRHLSNSRDPTELQCQ
jgi:hypothetical protein